MKRKIACRAVFYLLIVFAVACIVAASCLLVHYPVASYCLYGGTVALFAAQLFVAIGVTYCASKNKLNGFEQWATCWMVLAICIAFAVLSPVILILAIVGAIRQRILECRP